MAKERGSVGRAFGHLFRERQIYHRSEGVVHFIKLSSRTQIVFASILFGALLWVAYSSVNVVFKEQIIVAKDQQRRDEQAAYRRRLQDRESAYDEVTSLNFVYSREFEASLNDLQRQHDALRSLIDNKAVIDGQVNALTEALSAAGAPGGKKLRGTNRIMIDPVGREPTPRQSRVSALRREALDNVIDQEIAEGIENEILTEMRRKTAQLSASQVVTLASMEEGMVRTIRELERILMHTGSAARVLPQSSDTFNLNELAGEVLARVDTQGLIDPDEEFIGQGGPFIPVEDGAAPLELSTYFQTAARVQARINQLTELSKIVRRVPVGIPVHKTHRQSSGFGIRRDPFNRSKRSEHRGLDFSGPRRTPIVATAPGRVVRAGTYGTFGKMVEIDHGNGFRTRFAHLNSIKTRVGRTVELNQTIGLMGSTGRSTGTHLHYEILYRGRQVDPERFIEAGRYVFES